jgi:thioredoxin-dependent peroxiredoxin
MKYLRLVILASLLVGVRAAEVVDFSVESPVDGKVLKSSDLRGKFVALHFLLKTECPFCLKHTHEYATKARTLPNVAQVFLKPDGAEEIKAWAKKLQEVSEFPKLTVYRDADAALAKRLKIPDGYQFHGQSVHYPALVLLNEKGEEVFRYVGKGNTDRFSFEKLKAKVAELKGK